MFSVKRMLAFVAFPATLMVVPSVHPSAGGERVKIAGAFTMTYVKQERLNVPDAAGHVLLLTAAQGTNRNTGPNDFMPGAQVSILETLDLLQGNGSNYGYVTMSSGADSVIDRINGKVTTTVSPQGSPHTAFAGTWTTVKGTGQYDGIKASGTFRGRFSSQTEYTVDWEGEYSK